MHPCFTWDDAEAAELYRETEARSIVRSVRVIYDSEHSEPAYVHAALRSRHRRASRSWLLCQHSGGCAEVFCTNPLADARDRLNSAAKALEDLERVARGQINDEAVARVDAAKAAISHVANAAEVLATVK